MTTDHGAADNPWLDQLLTAERENHCGDLACQTRRTAAAVRVLTGWKEHQDYAWAVEAFEVEIGVRDPALLGKEPESIPSRASIEAAAFERGRKFAIEGSGTQTIAVPGVRGEAELRAALESGDEPITAILRRYADRVAWPHSGYDPAGPIREWADRIDAALAAADSPQGTEPGLDLPGHKCRKIAEATPLLSGQSVVFGVIETDFDLLAVLGYIIAGRRRVAQMWTTCARRWAGWSLRIASMPVADSGSGGAT